MKNTVAPLLLLLVAGTSAFLEEDFFPRDPRNVFFSGRSRNNIPAIREGVEQPFALNEDQWKQYVLQGGAATQECFCVADCSTGDLELFLHASRDFQMDVNFDWDCDDTTAASEKAEYCRIEPGSKFDCYIAVYGSTEATDCGVTCSFLTPP